MKKTWLSSTFFIGAMLSTMNNFAQQKNAFSIQQSVEYANKNAVQVRNALLDIEIQRQQNRQITSAAFPQINSTINLNDYLKIPTSLIPGDFFGQPSGTFKALQFGTKYNATAGIEANQLLFDGQVFVGLIARKVVVDYQTKVAEVTKEQIKANVYKIYYQLVIGKKQLASLDANITRFEKLLNDTKEIFKNGFAEKLDVDKVTVQLNNIRTEKVKVQNSLAAGNAGLKFLMNMPQRDELVLTDTLNESELKSGILDEAYDYKNRAEMKVLTIGEKLGGYNVRRYQLSKIPTLAAFANYNKNAQRTSFNFFNKGEWYTTSLIGLKIAIPIFDGNARNAHIQEAKYDLQKTRNTMEQVRASIDYEVQQSRINIRNALLTLDNQKKNIELAENVYITTKKKYEQGLGNNQEIYFAETELKVAQTNYYSSLYDAINARIDYLKAIGKL